jgi:hypothetical protein
MPTRQKKTARRAGCKIPPMRALFFPLWYNMLLDLKEIIERKRGLEGLLCKGWLASRCSFSTVYSYLANASCISYENIIHLLVISKLLTLDSTCEFVEEIIHKFSQIY